MAQYIIKPIKIRFVSGGVECTTLEQLRQNFAPIDIANSISQFRKWLNKYHGNDDIAKRIGECEFTENSFKKSKESLLELYQIVFKDCHFSTFNDVFFFFLQAKQYKTNFEHLHNVIKDADWSLSFAYEIIPYIIRRSKSETFNRSFSADSDGDLFEVYFFFLSGYMRKHEIKDLGDLYLHWDGYGEKYRSQLHQEIVETKWGENFIVELFPELIRDNRHYTVTANGDPYIMDKEIAFSLFQKYFDYYLKSKKINNISDLYAWWSIDSDYSKKECYTYLKKVMYKNLWGVWDLLDLYKNRKDIHTDEEWVRIFDALAECKTNKAEHLNQLGQIFIRDFDHKEKGKELLYKAKDLGNGNAAQYLKDRCNEEIDISEKFKKAYNICYEKGWDGHSDQKLKDMIEEELKESAQTLREKWICAMRLIIHKIINEGSLLKIDYFVLYIRDYCQEERTFSHDRESIKQLLSTAFIDERPTRLSEKRMNIVAEYDGNSLCEVRFTFALLLLKDYNEKGTEILKKLESIYHPAKYMLHDNEKNKVLDKGNFRYSVKTNFNEALKYYCQNMVNFTVAKYV